jgi:hypothetical protein
MSFISYPTRQFALPPAGKIAGARGQAACWRWDWVPIVAS